MKGNNGKGNVVERDEWETPKELFYNLDKQYRFKLDCCAKNHNTKLSQYCKDFLDSQLIWFHGVAWMNPPFSKANEMFEHFFKVVSKGVAIYRCDNMETRIWQKVIFPNASWIFIFNKRIAYEGYNKEAMKGSRFPSALIGFNVPIPKGLDGRCFNNV